jgi:titin
VYDSHCQGRQIIGLRFINVDIPSQAMIKKATIQFTCDEKTTAGCTLEIQGEDTDSSFVFNNQEKDISGRSRTRSAVGWRPVRWTRPGQANAMECTPDLKSIVQEIISRPGWSPGSSLSFIITGLGIGQRTAVSFETSPLKAARLTVDYEETIYRNKASGKNEQ